MSATSEVRARFDSGDKLVAAALAAGSILPFLALGRTWWSSEHMSHGFLVPLVSIAVAAQRSARLATLPSTVDWGGLVALVAALLVSLAGVLAGSVTLQGLGLVGCLAGAVWFRRGRAWLRALRFPIAFLVFMVPPPDEWHAPLVVWLQDLASRASVAGLYAAGVPVFRDGYMIEMVGGQRVEIAAACSGATSLYTMAALGTLLAALSLTRTRTRAALIALVVPVALAGNLTRVIATVLLSIQIGVARATEGLTHAALGLLTYVVAIGLLLAGDALLRRVELRIAR